MKLFKNLIFAVLLCLVLIVSSTLLNVEIKLPKAYENVCDDLCDKIIDFSSRKALPDLEYHARSLRDSASASRAEYDGLIDEYNSSAVGYSKSDTNAAEKAIRNYRSFISKLSRFPAAPFAELLNLSF